MDVEVLSLFAALSVLLVCSAVCSGAETAFFSMDEAELERLTRERSRTGRLSKFVMTDPRRLLVSILLANLTVNVLFFNLGSLLIARVSSPWISNLASGLLLAVLVLLGEVFPKTLAVHRGLAVARFSAVPMAVIVLATSPLRSVLAALASALANLAVGRREREGSVTAAELESLIALSHREGHLPRWEARYLQALMLLSTVRVKELMVPRVEVVSFALEEGRTRFMEVLRKHRRNKIPVHDGSLDRVRGFLDAKEVLAHPDTSLEDLLHPAQFVPETAIAASILDRLRSGSERILFVVDEYGGVEGLVTLENLVEAVVGDLADESDGAEEPALRRLGPGRFEMSGLLRVSLLRQLMGPVVEESDSATVSGLLVARLGRFPRVGDRVELGSLRLEVLSLDGRLPGRIVAEDRREQSIWGRPR